MTSTVVLLLAIVVCDYSIGLSLQMEDEDRQTAKPTKKSIFRKFKDSFIQYKSSYYGSNRRKQMTPEQNQMFQEMFSEINNFVKHINEHDGESTKIKLRNLQTFLDNYEKIDPHASNYIKKTMQSLRHNMQYMENRILQLEAGHADSPPREPEKNDNEASTSMTHTSEHTEEKP